VWRTRLGHCLQPTQRPRLNALYHLFMSSFESEPNGASSRKRARADDARENGHAPFADVRPPLSLSILGVEPVDEFIRDVADFVHGMIARRPEHAHGRVEVEAKVGVLRDRASGARLALPVVTEAGVCLSPSFVVYSCSSLDCQCYILTSSVVSSQICLQSVPSRVASIIRH
jgi:hypothetical protein